MLLVDSGRNLFHFTLVSEVGFFTLPHADCVVGVVEECGVYVVLWRRRRRTRSSSVLWGGRSVEEEIVLSLG